MFRYLVILLTLCLSLNACNFRRLELPLPTPDEDNIIYVTATPLTVVAQAAPTETATEIAPVAQPTPAIMAKEQLQSAESFTRNGLF